MHTTEDCGIDKRANSQGESSGVGFVRKNKRQRGMAQKIVLPKNSSFLSISGILGNQTCETSFLSDSKRQYGHITVNMQEPFKDLTEAHFNLQN